MMNSENILREDSGQFVESKEVELFVKSIYKGRVSVKDKGKSFPTIFFEKSSSKWPNMIYDYSSDEGNALALSRKKGGADYAYIKDLKSQWKNAVSWLLSKENADIDGHIKGYF